MVLASRGLRENEDGSTVAIRDGGLAALVRRRGRRVWVLAIVATTVVAFGLVLVPRR